jgi:hypothetical protein
VRAIEMPGLLYEGVRTPGVDGSVPYFALIEMT